MGACAFAQLYSDAVRLKEEVKHSSFGLMPGTSSSVPQ